MNIKQIIVVLALSLFSTGTVFGLNQAVRSDLENKFGKDVFVLGVYYPD